MSAFAIKLIPNVEHTRRVLGTRWALRIVPPSEGVFACDRDGAEGGDANAAPVPQDRQARAEGIAEPQSHGD